MEQLRSTCTITIAPKNILIPKPTANFSAYTYENIYIDILVKTVSPRCKSYLGLRASP